MPSLKLTCLSCGQVNRVPQEKIADGGKCAVCGAALVTGAVAEVDLATLRKAAQSDDLPLLVDFWAPWCGPCRAMAPEFTKAAGMLKGKARLAKLNTEADQAAGQAYAIRSIPTLVKFAGGREVKRQAGATGAAQIVSFAS